MKKAIPSLRPFLAFFMGYESAAAPEGFHQIPQTTTHVYIWAAAIILMVSLLRIIKILLANQNC